MKIFRIQNSAGIGPYGGASPWSKWQTDSHEWPVHPSPREDLGIERFPEHCIEFCGFDSITKLIAWFDASERAALASMGFFIYEFTINKKHVTFGEKQCLFIRDKASRVSCLGM